MEIDLGLLRDQNWLVFCVRAGIDLFFVWGSIELVLVWGWNWLVSCVGIEMNLVFRGWSKLTWCQCGRSKLTWFQCRIGTDLVFVPWSKITWIQCGVWNWLGFRVGIAIALAVDRTAEIDLVYVSPERWLDFIECMDENLLGLSAGIKKNLVFVCGSELTSFSCGDRLSLLWCGGEIGEIELYSVFASKLTWSRVGGRNWLDFSAGIQIHLVLCRGRKLLGCSEEIEIGFFLVCAPEKILVSAYAYQLPWFLRAVENWHCFDVCPEKYVVSVHGWKLTWFCVRIEIGVKFVCGPTMTYLVLRGHQIWPGFCVAGRNLFYFCVRLGIVWALKLDSFLCGSRNRLHFSAGIGIDLSIMCGARKWLCLNVWIEIVSFLWRGIQIGVILEWGSK